MSNSNNITDKNLYKRLLVRSILAVIVFILLFIILPKALKLLFPFVIAFIAAIALNPIVNRINKKLGISRKFIAAVLDLLFFLIAASLFGLLIYSVVSQAGELATYIQMNWNDIIEKFSELENSFAWLINLFPPQISEILANFEDSIVELLQNISKNLISSLISATTMMTTKTGNFFINFIMAILGAYFIISDYNIITAKAKESIGKRFSKYLTILRHSALSALGGYVKSQLLLALFAFVFMFIALTLYRQPYALLIALFLGFIDLLPIVGTIAVLAPWGIIELISGDLNKGIYLLIIGIAFFLIRKVIEPKIVGSQTGLHPLAALISTFVGLQFSGVWGAVLGPIVLMLVISIVKSGIFDRTIADLKAVAKDMTMILYSKNTKTTKPKL